MSYLGLTVCAIAFIIPSVITSVSAILPLQEAMSLQRDMGVKSEINSHQDTIINENTHDNNLDQQNDDNNDNNDNNNHGDNNCNSQHSNCSNSDSTAKNTIDGIRLEIPFP